MMKPCIVAYVASFMQPFPPDASSPPALYLGTVHREWAWRTLARRGYEDGGSSECLTGCSSIYLTWDITVGFHPFWMHSDGASIFEDL